MTFRFSIPGRLPGLNEIINASRTNRYAGASQKRQTQRLCGEWIVSSRTPTFSHPVSISFVWIEPDNRRDVDNICAGAKFALDALVETGRIPNDSRRWVKAIAHSFPPPDKSNPRVEVTIEEIE